MNRLPDFQAVLIVGVMFFMVGCNAVGENPIPPGGSGGGIIAFASNRDGGDHDIYIMNADGSNQTALTDNRAGDFSPDWSPDGTRIAFDSDRNGNWDIFVMNSEGGNVVCLTPHSPALEIYPDWSPDGNYVAYQTAYENNNDEIAIVHVATGQMTRLTVSDGIDTYPSWKGIE